MPTKRILLCATEEQEQIALFEWAQHIPLLREYLFHIPNGGSRNLIEAKKLKRMGAKAGVVDIFLPIAKHGFHGFWGELKRRDQKISKVTNKQSEWLRKMELQGYKTAVWYGWEQAKNDISLYININ